MVFYYYLIIRSINYPVKLPFVYLKVRTAEFSPIKTRDI